MKMLRHFRLEKTSRFPALRKPHDDDGGGGGGDDDDDGGGGGGGDDDDGEKGRRIGRKNYEHPYGNINCNY